VLLTLNTPTPEQTSKSVSEVCVVSSQQVGEMASDHMTVAALGRPFTLGMLYDARSDKLVPGKTSHSHKAFIIITGQQQFTRPNIILLNYLLIVVVPF